MACVGETNASHFLDDAFREHVKQKKHQKTCKKVLTLKTRCGIIYKSTRYGTETKAKVARHLKFVILKLNIEPIKKRMCGSSAF